MKYKLTNKKIDYLGRTLYQIEAVKKFGNIAKGQKGGFIEKKSNLSQDGNAWVYNYAMVYGDAKVCDNAKVYDCAKVRGAAVVRGNARVYGDALVCDNADVYENAKVYGHAKVRNSANVHGRAKVCGHADVCGNAWVYSNAEVYGDAKVHGAAVVCDNAKVYDCANVRSAAVVCDNAIVRSNSDYLIIGPIDYQSGTTTFFKTSDKDKAIKVACNGFTGDIDAFQKKVIKTHGKNNYAKEYKLAIEIAKIHILGKQK